MFMPRRCAMLRDTAEGAPASKRYYVVLGALCYRQYIRCRDVSPYDAACLMRRDVLCATMLPRCRVLRRCMRVCRWLVIYATLCTPTLTHALRGVRCLRSASRVTQYATAYVLLRLAVDVVYSQGCLRIIIARCFGDTSAEFHTPAPAYAPPQDVLLMIVIYAAVCAAARPMRGAKITR